MIYEDYCYSELVIGSVKNRGNIVPVNEILPRLEQCDDIGCYRSHFRFTIDYQKYVIETGKVKGYRGPSYVDFLWFDIDRKDPELTMEENVRDALDDVQIYMNRLMYEYKVPPAYLRCFFSGMKGFHIGIPAEAFGLKPSKELPGICKSLVEKLAGDLDYDEGIYDRTRIFRLNNTRHEESGLYKVELEPQELLACSDVRSILDVAVSPRTLNRDYDPEDSYGTLTHMLPESSDEVGKLPALDVVTNSWLTDLLTNGATPGGRTHGATRLAGYYSSKEIPEDVALALITSWDNDKNVPPLADTYGVDKVVDTVADIYQYPQPDSLSEIDVPEPMVLHNWQTLHDAAPAYIETFAKNRLRFGYPEIDDKSALLGRGEVCIILAYVGVGKTVLAQNLQMTIMEEQKVPSVLFSLEMSAMMLYFRQIGMRWGMSAKEIMRVFADGGGEGLRRGMDGFDDMYIVDHVPLSVPLMTECIQQCGKDIGLIIVDYVGLLSDEGRDNYERMNNLSRNLVLMAKSLNIAIIAIYQTNRTGANGEIHLGMGRDSGMIEANCDMALGLWPDPEWPAERKVKLLKARHGLSGAQQSLAFMGSGPRLYVTGTKEVENRNDYA